MLETTKLILRQWDAKDKGPFADLNADHVSIKHTV